MKADHTPAQLCAAFDVTRSGYHAWARAGPGAREQAGALLLPKIRAVHQEHRGRYGAPRIQKEPAAHGARHGGKRIARLMKAAGLRGLCPRQFVPRTTDSRHGRPIAPNLLAQRPAPTGPDRTWATGLACVPTEEGWLYVAVVLDLWSRRVVGWATAPTLHSALAIDALRMALQQRRPPPGLLHHSDRGVQYAGGYATRADATADLFLYAETYYNRVRRHSALGSGSPVDFELQFNQPTHAPRLQRVSINPGQAQLQELFGSTGMMSSKVGSSSSPATGLLSMFR